ncbi:MAG TPA: MBL fold metallo-hydrolase [Armatimonadota bacterium]|nr:MBL fold metallo-hydrolase [Armatimonadota bacterium]
MIEPEKNVPSKTPYGKVGLADLHDPNSRHLTIWWLGNAGFAINWAGAVIFIDPIIEPKNGDEPMVSEIDLPLRGPLPLRARQVERADLILLTHDDGDHTGPRTTPELIARTSATFVGTDRTWRKLRDYALPPERFLLAEYARPLQAAGFTITPTPARHQEDEGHTVRGDCCGFILERAGIRLWHPDDTDLLEEHLAVKDIDVLLLPIAPHVLATAGSIRLADSTRAPHIIPCHYGTYDSDQYWCTGDPEAVCAGIEDAAERYHHLAIGEKLSLPL